MIGVLIRKQIHESLSYFRRNRKNIDVVGMFLSLALVAIVVFVITWVFGEFIVKYQDIRVDGVKDRTARLYEIMTIVYEAVLVISTLGSVTALTHAIFENDDRNVLVVLPIKPQAIFIVKMITVYFKQALVALCIVLPLSIIFAFKAELTNAVSFIAISAVSGLLVPFISLGLASVLSLPFYFIKRLIQSKYILFLVVITVVAGGLFYGYSYILQAFQTLMAEGDIKYLFSGTVMKAIIQVTSNMYPAKFISDIVFNREALSSGLILLGIIVGLGVLGFVVEYFLYNFAIKIRVQNNDGVVFHAKKLSRPRSVTSGLIAKEFGSIFFTPDYAFQYISVAAILPIMVYLCMGIGSEMLFTMLQQKMNLELALLLTVLFGSLTNTFCAINISREGRSFYMQKTLPIKHSKYISVKIGINFIVTLLSVGVTAVLLMFAKNKDVIYLTVNEGLFVFAVGVIMGLAQICIATRKDLNKPFFPTEEDNIVKEGNANVSTIIILGLVLSIVTAGVPLIFNLIGSLRETGMEYFTYIFSGSLAVITLIASLLYAFIGLRAKFERLSEGD